ncbi:serine/threonine-protein phosphatase 2A 65 kDa regulatory subunit A alpha isoform [Diabrotica virgifera virgifera]|uniref:Serine/threonine-protein phosphatase 2A 65 kDa regulatory subunit A alpha isoform-like n=1 Tax=Diabrotica virgifera virgifera TaxID=50390 RepID=A0A6P7FTE4_DIAVI|nr:serine/threonine-protein phosphatase 2A 65 kDa regulatory subunit A alpha isoform [Diabrotica virgifera virgifera]
MSDESVLMEDLKTFKESFSQAIKDENITEQIDMTKRLGILAEHLGENITRQELLPFLEENMNFHDEILLNLPEQLKKLIPLVGGYENSQPVLELLKKICNIDEFLVREKTLETLKGIAEELSNELVEELLVPILESLANEQWFTSKCSAVALFSSIYPKVQEERKAELRHNFRLLSQDESPIVRKEAALGLIDFIALLDKESIKNEFISVFDNISNDNMDSVKATTVKVALAICKILSENEIEESIFKTLESFAESESWKTRHVLAVDIAEIQKVIYYHKLRGRILAMFQKLIKNVEDEVRIVAVRNLVPYCRCLKESYERTDQVENNFESVFIQSLVPQITMLVVDTCTDVKLELAKNILSLSTLISKETFVEHIMPLVLDILDLEQSVSVKANILENLNDLPADVDFDQSLPSIKRVIRTLIVYSQSHWRTRKGLLVTFMHIIKFAPKEYFAENIKHFYGSLLGDHVFAVRRTAAIILPLIVKHFGMTWTSAQIIPYFKMFQRDTRYLYRYVPIFGINELIEPSVLPGEEKEYLASLKKVEDKNKAANMLWMLKCILKKLESLLEEKTFQDILSLNKSIDDFKTDNISLYAGETLNSLRSHYSENIFSYDGTKAENSNDWYLTGVLFFIYRECLGLLLTLFDDRIVNVQIRSIFTINKIKVFVDKLLAEIKEPWVEETLQVLKQEELDRIEEELNAELVEKSEELDEENINTELIDSIITTSRTSLQMGENNLDEYNKDGIREMAIDVVEKWPENVDNVQTEKFETVISADSVIETKETENTSSEKPEPMVVDVVAPDVEITEVVAANDTATDVAVSDVAATDITPEVVEVVEEKETLDTTVAPAEDSQVPDEAVVKSDAVVKVEEK